MNARRALGIAGGALTAAVALSSCGNGNDDAKVPGNPAPASSSATNTQQVQASDTAPTDQGSASASAPTSGSGGTPAVTPECKAATLSVKTGAGDAGAGNVYQPLIFTNKSSAPCVIVGFPGLSYVTGDSGLQVGAAAVRTGKIGAQITLQPGDSASARIHAVNVGVFDEATCKPTNVRGYRVYAPDDTAAIFVPFATRGCTGKTPDPQLEVGTITAS